MGGVVFIKVETSESLSFFPWSVSFSSGLSLMAFILFYFYE